MRDEYNFNSVQEAREANCHGIYKDKTKYKIRKYELVLVEDDCDPATEMEKACAEEEKKREKEIQERCNEMARKVYRKSYNELSLIEQISIGCGSLV